MDHFHFQAGALHCENVPVAKIAETVGTPAYIYSKATFLHHYRAVHDAFAALDPLICYSIKSCGNLSICNLLKSAGAGFDIVSGGELARAQAIGADMSQIVFAGVGKSDEEIEQAIDAGVGWFNVESEAEMENLITISRRKRVRTRAALRVNPDVDPRTHRYTSTGKKESKFGVDLERGRRFFDAYGRDAAVHLCGIHLHIGSPVNDIAPYVGAITKGIDLIDALRADGFDIDTIDIGGGFGAHYRDTEAPPAVRYAEAIVPLLKDKRLKVIMEPGRSIAANAGILLTRTLYLKQSGDRDFLIVDAGMNDLLRPALYEAYHFAWPVAPRAGFVPKDRASAAQLPGLKLMDIVGPVCESGDFLAKDRMLPPMQRGDLVAVYSAGAYGMSMASHYNSRPNPPEVLVDGDDFRVIRRRETYDDLMAAERL
ncbi:MAG: diaminopimelate decarboxylase [Phycisphaerales bacterium]|nr:diaminopimelate decarboxylase [Phycisphaerales bacterium]MCB9855882.1 diaminopimelate decarboxylase [Phycisphaerales bacterium]